MSTSGRVQTHKSAEAHPARVPTVIGIGGKHNGKEPTWKPRNAEFDRFGGRKLTFHGMTSSIAKRSWYFIAFDVHVVLFVPVFSCSAFLNSRFIPAKRLVVLGTSGITLLLLLYAPRPETDVEFHIFRRRRETAGWLRLRAARVEERDCPVPVVCKLPPCAPPRTGEWLCECCPGSLGVRRG